MISVSRQMNKLQLRHSSRISGFFNVDLRRTLNKFRYQNVNIENW